MSESKRDAEIALDQSILQVADCLSFPISEEVAKSIRKEVIEEVVRLSKESQDGRD